MKAKYYTESDVRKIIENAEKQGRKDAIDGMLLFAVWAIHDVIDPAPETIQKCIDFMISKCEFIQSQEISFSDIQKMLLDETGIKLHFNETRFK